MVCIKKQNCHAVKDTFYHRYYGSSANGRASLLGRMRGYLPTRRYDHGVLRAARSYLAFMAVVPRAA